MYFWNVHAVKNELRRGMLAPAHAMRYLMGIWLLFTFGVSSYLVFPVAHANVWDMGMLVVSALAVPLGVRAAYRANGGADGIDFIARFHALAWVVGWRVVIPTLAFLVVAATIYGVVSPPPIGDPPNTDVVGFAGAVVCQFFFYWRLAVHMRDVTQFTDPEPSASAAV